MSELTKADLKVGHVYSAKRPAAVGFFEPLVNDRQILWMDSFGVHVQYDSPTVKFSRKYPKVTVEQFLRWAKADVTDLCPNGEWRALPRAQSTPQQPAMKGSE